MFSIAALMASFASCGNIDPETPPVNDPAAEDTPPPPPPPGTTTLTISAGSVNIDSKTYMKGGETRWINDDVITVFAEDGTSAMSDPVVYEAGKEEAPATWDFTVEGWDASKTPLYALAAGPQSYYTYFPRVGYSEGAVRVRLRPGQELYHAGTFGKFANIGLGELICDSETGTYSAEMKNLCGLVRFKVEGSNVAKVVISDAGGKAMTGEVDIVMTDGVPTVKSVVAGVDSVAITAAKSSFNDKTGLIPSDKYAYACILPGTYNFVVESYELADDGKTYVLLNRLVGGVPMTVTRNVYETIDPYVDTYKPTPGDGGDEEELPEVEPLVLTLDFANGPFDGVNTIAEKLADENGDTYTYTYNDVSYQFAIYTEDNPDDAVENGGTYKIASTYIEANTKAGKFKLKLPAIENHRLTGVQVSVKNTVGKYIGVLNSGGGTVGSVTSAVVGESPYTIDVDASKVGVNTNCYISTASGKTQFTKLVLTYTYVKPTSAE